MTTLLKEYYDLYNYYGNLPETTDEEENRLDIEFTGKIHAVLEQMSVAEIQHICDELKYSGDKRMFMPYLRAAKEREAAADKMTKLIEQYLNAFEEAQEKGKHLELGEDGNEKDFDKWEKLCHECHEKQQPILAQMSREELEYVLEYCVYSGIAKHHFRQKWLSSESKSAARRAQ
jgi:hypothetical protein